MIKNQCYCSIICLACQIKMPCVNCRAYFYNEINFFKQKNNYIFKNFTKFILCCQYLKSVYVGNSKQPPCKKEVF